MPQAALDWGPLLQSDITTNSSSKTFTVPAGRIWEVKWIYCALTSNGTAGNRQLTVEALSSSTVIARVSVGIVQAASVTRNYMLTPHASDLTAFRDTTFLMTPIPELILPQNLILKVYDKTAVDPTGTAENLLVYMMVRQYGQA